MLKGKVLSNAIVGWYVLSLASVATIADASVEWIIALSVNFLLASVSLEKYVISKKQDNE